MSNAMKVCDSCGHKFNKAGNKVKRVSGETVNVCPNCGRETFYNNRSRRIAENYLIDKYHVDAATVAKALQEAEDYTYKAEKLLEKAGYTCRN